MDDQIKKFLTNYLEDLEYQFGMGGIEYVNYNSCRTPFFNTDDEYKKYVAELRAKIEAA